MRPPAALASAPAAPHVDHIRYALNALVEHRRGKVSIEGCRPAETWAWMFTVHEAVALSPESTTDPTDYSRDWTVSIHNADVSAEADKLTRLLHEDLGRNPSDPLFISFMGI